MNYCDINLYMTHHSVFIALDTGQLLVWRKLYNQDWMTPSFTLMSQLPQGNLFVDANCMYYIDLHLT